MATAAAPGTNRPLASDLKVEGVPSVRHRDGGQAMTIALPITSLIGTVLVLGLQSAPVLVPLPARSQWKRESAESLR